MPPTPPPPAGPSPAGPSPAELTVGVLLLAGAGAAIGVIKDRSARNAAAPVSAPSAAPSDTDPFGPFGGDPFSPDPFSGGGPLGGATVDEGSAALNMPTGRTIHVSDTDGRWTVTAVSAAWRTTNCDTSGVAPAPMGKLFVVNVAFEVTLFSQLATWEAPADPPSYVRGGNFTTLTKNSSICRTTAMNRSKSTGLVTYALACSW